MTPRPLGAGCSSFVFFNVIGAAGILRAPHTAAFGRSRDDLPSYGAAAVGYMRNVDSAQSVGASAELGYGLTGRFSVKAHWRRWSPRGSLDLSAGPLFTDVLSAANAGDIRERATGATADVALVGSSGLGVFGGADMIHGGGRTSTGVHAGVHLEARWAIAAAATAGIVYGILYRVLLHD